MEAERQDGTCGKTKHIETYRMNRKIFIFAIVALAAFGGCHKQLVTDVPAHSQGMVVGVKTETASLPKVTFLFWHQAYFYR